MTARLRTLQSQRALLQLQRFVRVPALEVVEVVAWEKRTRLSGSSLANVLSPLHRLPLPPRLGLPSRSLALPRQR